MWIDTIKFERLCNKINSLSALRVLAWILNQVEADNSDIPINQTNLANELGTTKQEISRSIKTLEAVQAVKAKGKIGLIKSYCVNSQIFSKEDPRSLDLSIKDLLKSIPKADLHTNFQSILDITQRSEKKMTDAIELQKSLKTVINNVAKNTKKTK